MKKLTSFAAFAAVLIGIIPGSVPADETPANESKSPAAQAPAPAGTVMPERYPPPPPGAYAPAWQQAPRWPMPQPMYGQLPPQYPPGGHYQAYPAAPATVQPARENPLSAELQETQDQLSAKNSELDAVHRMLGQLRNKLQESLAAEKTMSDRLAHTTREQQALQVRVEELGETLSTSKATLEQQYQLINNHLAHNQQLAAERDQLHAELATRGEQLAMLQSQLQALTEELAHAKSRTGAAVEALGAVRERIGAHRDALSKLEGDLQRQEILLQGGNPG